MRAINLVNLELALGSAPTTVYNSLLVRVVATTAGTIQRKDYLGLNTSSCTILTTEPTYLFKEAGDTLTSTSGVLLAAPITFMY